MSTLAQEAAVAAASIVTSAAAHRYLYLRLVKDVTASARLRRAGRAAAVALTILVPTGVLAAQYANPTHIAWLAWPAFVWVALAAYLLMTLVVLEIPVRLTARALRRRTGSGLVVPAQAPRVPVAQQGHSVAAPTTGDTHPQPAQDAPRMMDRRLVLARSVALLATTTAVATTGYGFHRGLGAPDVKVVPVALRRLHPSLDGMRITMASDLHLGPFFGRPHTARMVRMINDTSPDLVAIVGDLSDSSAQDLATHAAPLTRLSSPHGTFFVTGNHDYRHDIDAWIATLADFRVTTLRNTRTLIKHRHGAIDLAGVTDITGEQNHDTPDYDRALGDRDASHPVVLLAHQPVQVHEAARHKVDLQLSGHTHGGAFFPGNLLVPLTQPLTAGLATIDHTQLYVSRGVGASLPPIRVGAPPDITVIELRRQ
ncbi:metallophosphoesterase [Streptomyces sp. NBC_00365]|uniref:metallophosphoesterase n=1 Tax=Streptomyces sp. NBC_00365 TaxID=2975726 RepID=UPI0022537C78|nr:metallophosphoesterase [Streptomyces sp. NBC_00365]MCX5097639.1 metallophosphoesterase [Streptomyces sp. NBC_00365]